MSFQEFLDELRRAQLDNCPVTVETIIRALDRLADNTTGTHIGDTVITLLRGGYAERGLNR